jgi:Na+/melibiose symporter-like transporter
VVPGTLLFPLVRDTNLTYSNKIIKGVSPVQSGVNMLPTMLAQLVSTVVAGGMISWLGYYNPFLLLGTMLVAIGSGLFTTMGVDTGIGRWIAYEIIFGLGGGMCKFR